MQQNGPRQPPICEIYAAFDADSHRVFRAAMCRSRGGVVRLDDLLAAAGESSPSLRAAADLTRSLNHAEPVPIGRSGSVPLANEPLLRQALAAALRLAREQSGPSRGCITPAVLLAAAALTAPSPADANMSELFAQLGLRAPDWALDPAGRTAEPPEQIKIPPSAEVLDELYSSGENLCDVILRRWLVLRKLPTGPARDNQMAELRRLAEHA